MSLSETSNDPKTAAVQGTAGPDNQGNIGAGVFGVAGFPVFSGAPPPRVGVLGTAVSVVAPSAGVYGAGGDGQGVYGVSESAEGVQGVSNSNQHAGVSGINNAGGVGLFAQGSGDPLLIINHLGTGGNPALWLQQDGQQKAFVWWDQKNNALQLGTAITNPILTLTDDGIVHCNNGTLQAKGINGINDILQINATLQVNGDHYCNTMHAALDVVLGSDCAEDFDIAPAVQIEPGTVMVLDANGTLRPSEQGYDKKVAGVISGAGDYRPGLILGRSESPLKRMPLALVGKVYCKVDAQYAPVEVGDLLTTSPTLGHAMRAVDPLKAFGAVIGKALQPLPEGCGLVPILVSLQ